MSTRPDPADPAEHAARPQPGSRVTIFDVAVAAEVRPSTVSKALNGGRGSAEVRRRVQEAAAQLGYRPNRRASGLRRSRSSSIGVLVPDLANPSFLPFLRGAEQAARERGYVVLIADGQRSTEVESAALGRFFEQGVDGLLLAGPVPAAQLELFRDHGVPVDPPLAGYGSNGMSFWERGESVATEQMAARLLELGHRRLTFVSPPQPRGATGRRYRRGRLGTLNRLFLAEGAELSVTVIDPLDGLDCGLVELRRALRESRPTAVVCASHLLTPWLLIALRDESRLVPRDVSVVAYGDSDWAQAHQPPLSVIWRDTYAEGRDLADRLFTEIDGTDPTPTAEADARFIERASVRRSP